MNNIEQFSIYTAKIFEHLYSEFPIPKFIDQNEMVKLYLSFDKVHEIKKQEDIKGSAKLAMLFKDMDPDGFEEVLQPQLIGIDIGDRFHRAEGRLRELKVEEQTDRQFQLDILAGTIDFLVSEGLIVLVSRKGYRLTSKSFSHLNKSFKGGKVEGEEESFILAIKNMFKQTGTMSKDIFVGTAVAIIPKLLSYS